MKKYLVILSLLPLAACTTFSKKECVEMNWHQRGIESAYDGQTASKGATYYAEQCHKEHGVPVNEALFSQGYQQGLQAFCTPENLRDFAARGGVYEETCPEKSMTANVRQQYQASREQYLVRKIQELKEQISELEGTVSAQKSEIDSLNKKCN